VLIFSRRFGPASLLACQQSAALAHRVARLGLPRRWGVRWYGEATYHAVLSLTRYFATFAAPFALVYARRRRQPLALALLVLPAFEEWRRRDTTLDPLRWIGVALADDAAYGTGVFWGCLKEGTVRPLIPTLTAMQSRAEPPPRCQVVKPASVGRT
jgi:hypothetical protein